MIGIIICHMKNQHYYSKQGSSNHFNQEQEFKIVDAMSALGASSFCSATLVVAGPSWGKV